MSYSLCSSCCVCECVRGLSVTMHKDWLTVWPWHAHTLHAWGWIPSPSLSPKTPLSFARTHTHADIQFLFVSLSPSLSHPAQEPEWVTRFAHFLQIALTHGFRREGTGSWGRAQGPKAEKKLTGAVHHHIIQCAREPEKRCIGWLWRHCPARERADIAVRWGRSKEIIPERSERRAWNRAPIPDG